jgi:diguanylate cyclase (GGDEF)-like protein
MPDTLSSQRFHKSLYPLLGFYLFSLFLVSVLWEFKLERTTMTVLGLPYDGDFETAERWRFVLTSTGFALLSLVMPVMLLQRLLRRLKRSYFDLLTAQMQSDAFARYDPLSGLLNRRVFNEQLVGLLQEQQQTAVFLIDLDNFKAVNDTGGHAAGDAAICAVAERLRDATHGWQASLARLGGDEFALAVTGNVNRAELALLAEDLLARISRPVPGWPAINLSATLGIALAPMDGVTPESLLQRADRAMYRGKQSGRAVFHFYEASFEAEQREQAVFEQELREAIRNDQIQPFYQPIVKLPEQSLSGFEILARWQHPRRGMVMPLTFIAVAEQLELIRPLTQSLLMQAFTHARAWPDTLMMAINVSSSMIEDPTFPTWLENLASKGNFPLARLEIEVTESTLVANVASARQNLETLRTMGVSVALDDFGTGYSGLYHLTQLSIDKIKIDRSFLDCSQDNQNDMVRAILALGKSLSMQVTAEGVEHDRVASWLADHECDFAQGYLFGQPISSWRVNEVLQQGAAQGPVRYGEQD